MVIFFSGRSFHLIDTPGLSDPRAGADTRNITDMVEKLKMVKDIHLFLIGSVFDLCIV